MITCRTEDDQLETATCTTVNIIKQVYISLSLSLSLTHTHTHMCTHKVSVGNYAGYQVPKLTQHSKHTHTHTHTVHLIPQQKTTTVSTNSGPQQISCSSYVTAATNSYKTMPSLLCLCKLSVTSELHNPQMHYIKAQQNILHLKEHPFYTGVWWWMDAQSAVK